MDDGNDKGSDSSYDILRMLRGQRQDERGRLNGLSYASLQARMASEAATADLTRVYIERVRGLAFAAGRDTTIFQAVVVTSLQTLHRVLDRERQAAAAAISLAQGDKMRDMVRATEAMIAALTATLSKQGSKMLHLCSGTRSTRGEASWWFALTETIEALEEGKERMAAIVYGQPKGAPARTLSSLVVRLLHHQHNALLAEAEQWIS